MSNAYKYSADSDTEHAPCMSHLQLVLPEHQSTDMESRHDWGSIRARCSAFRRTGCPDFNWPPQPSHLPVLASSSEAVLISDRDTNKKSAAPRRCVHKALACMPWHSAPLAPYSVSLEFALLSPCLVLFA